MKLFIITVFPYSVLKQNWYNKLHLFYLEEDFLNKYQRWTDTLCKFETLALDATCGLTRVLQHCDLLRAVGAQEQLGASGARGGGDHVAEHGRRRHHVIPLEHRQGGEALVHDVG